MAKTADRLLDGIKRRVVIPSSQPLLEDEDMLEVADDVIEQIIVPVLLSVRQDFLVTTPYEQASVADQAAYDIHYRSIGRGLRDLKIEDGSEAVSDMVLLKSEDAHRWPTSGTPFGFYFRGDKFVVVPAPSSADFTFHQTYNLAPSRLVLVAQAAVVTAVAATTVTVSSIPSVIATGTVVDFVQAKSGSSILAMDKTVVTAAGTTLTFATGVIPSDLAVGDYVSVYQTTPVIPIPNEAYPLLEAATARRVLNMIGDFEGAKALAEEEADAEKRLKMLLEPRIQGEATKIINRNGLLKGRRSGWRRGLFSE